MKALSSKHAYLQTSKGVIAPEATPGKPLWVVGRSFCTFNRYDLKGLPKADWLGVVSLSVEQASPYDQFAVYVVLYPESESALVWCWDDATVKQNLIDHQLPESCEIVPESVLLASGQSGFRLQKVCDGVEGQVWDNGELLDSIFWAGQPIKYQLDIFMANYPNSQIADIAESAPGELLQEPWAKNSAQHFVKVSGSVVKAGLAVGFCYLAILMWQSLNIAYLHSAILDVSDQVDDQKSTIGEILEARDLAYQSVEQIKRLRDELPAVSQTEVLNTILNKLPRNGVTLQKWQFREGELSFVLKGKSFDPRFYVSAFESVPFIRSVSTQTDQKRGLLTVKASVSMLSDESS